jgi:membrane protein YqaA with SNARE-associated domain
LVKSRCDTRIGQSVFIGNAGLICTISHQFFDLGRKQDDHDQDAECSVIIFAVYGLLCLSAFLSATLLPGSSEAVLLGLLTSGQVNPAMLVLFASVGNVAGAMVNWGLGLFFENYKDKSWFPIQAAAMARAQVWFARWGLWSLLLSWVPVIGDPLTLVAGVLRVPFGRFLVLVTIGKVARYGLLVLAWQHWGMA